MKIFNLKRAAGISALSLVALLGTSELANAQGTWSGDRRQDRIERQRAELEKQRIKAEQERQAELNRRDNGWGNTNNSDRYRVYRNGSYYSTNRRGAELLRQAVNEGYRQGFAAGRSDRNSRRRMSWTNSNVYRRGNQGYQRGVDSRQYQYYFQQGFQKGYQDGFNSRNQYGSYQNGSQNILSAILGQILNIRSY